MGYEERIQQTLGGTKDLKKYENQLRTKEQEIGDYHSLIDLKDQIIARIERDCDKAVSEMRSFKERCKEVEQDLEMSGRVAQRTTPSSAITSTKPWQVEWVRLI